MLALKACAALKYHLWSFQEPRWLIDGVNIYSYSPPYNLSANAESKENKDLQIIRIYASWTLRSIALCLNGTYINVYDMQIK